MKIESFPDELGAFNVRGERGAFAFLRLSILLFTGGVLLFLSLVALSLGETGEPTPEAVDNGERRPPADLRSFFHGDRSGEAPTIEVAPTILTAFFASPATGFFEATAAREDLRGVTQEDGVKGILKGKSAAEDGLEWSAEDGVEWSGPEPEAATPE